MRRRCFRSVLLFKGAIQYAVVVLAKGNLVTIGSVLLLLGIGIAVGVFSGMLGIGGAIIVIPILVFFFGFTQQKANGTSLAMLLPPIGIFAVMTYHKANNIDWTFAMLLAAGFAVGAFVGGWLVNTGAINQDILRKSFIVLLIYITVRMAFRADPAMAAAVKTIVAMLVCGCAYLVFKLVGRRWARAPYWPAVYREKLATPVTNDYEI